MEIWNDEHVAALGFLQSCRHVVRTCFGNSEIKLRRWEKKRKISAGSWQVRCLVLKCI